MSEGGKLKLWAPHELHIGLHKAMSAQDILKLCWLFVWEGQVWWMDHELLRENTQLTRFEWSVIN